MSSRLVMQLQLEEGIAPRIYQAYWLGALNNPERKQPRDIVRFADPCTRKKVLELTRTRSSLQYKGHHVSVFPDLSQEALQLCKDFKFLTAQLQKYNLCFKWFSLTRVCFFIKGKFYNFAYYGTGEDLHSLCMFGALD